MPLKYFLLILILPICFVYAESEWLTIPVVGEYRHWDPPKNPDVFNLQYTIINGSVSNVDAVQSRTVFHIESDKSGILQMKIPKNYPFTDYPQEGREKDALYVKINGLNVNEDSIDIEYDECFYFYAVSFSPNDSEITVGFSKTLSQVLPYMIDDVPSHCVSDVFAQPPFPRFIAIQFSPLAQIQLGTNIHDVQCKDDLSLTIKQNDEKSVCVKESSIISLMIRGWAKITSFEIASGFFDHSIYNGNVTSIQFIQDDCSPSVIVKIDSMDQGNLTIPIPRIFVDPKIEQEDDEFFVLVDGKEINFHETLKDSKQRTLEIPFSKDSKNIEITKTCLI